jgi:ATP-dependent RNA helicase DeaD
LSAALPQTRLGRKLVKRLGAESAVEALIAMAYGEKLDPSRYGAITELSEDPKREVDFKQHPIKGGKRSVPARPAGGNFPGGGEGFSGGGSRVYVGLGRRNGAGARDVAELLGRAGGIPGRLVDDIEVKDYCAFATLPEDAARRACTFSRNTPGDPIIKPAAGTASGGKRGPPRSRR